MGIDNNIFAKEKINKLLLKFAVPAMFALLVSELYNMVDTVYVGRYIGANAIAALTIAFPIQRLLVAIGLLISVGASTYVARSLGEKNISELKKVILTSLSLALIILIIVSIAIFIFRIPILHGLGASELTYPLAKKYVSIILIGGIFQCLSVVACNIMISLGKTRVSLHANLIGATLNIIINYILIVVMKLEIEGAAIATVISQIFAFVFAFYKFNDVRKVFQLQFSIYSISSSINKKVLSGILTVGFSTFVIEISDAVVSVVLNNILYAEGGDSAIVMIGIITKVSMFMFITIIGMSSAAQPIIAYNFGAENYERMKKTVTTSIKVVIITSFTIWLIFMFFSNTIIGFFLKDTVLLIHTVKAFRLCISLLPLVGVYYVGIYYYQAIGEAKKSFLFSIYRETILFIPLAILFVQIFGIKGAWAAYPITDAIATLTSAYFLRKALKEDFSKDKSLSNLPELSNVKHF
ncbi:MATE family efflux transporter [Clostridiaceae bacterium UIB06]|uniref:Multidrug export protein MepA n=1 Tax=Clostridium thailandense TaxID=2794346 RepID=A0A949WTQ3_9CLOT|nr:MATE family efflux transporter [Clostridium thailandense]MBV7276590.1 MATE family efflux transporter [Clostridium thailandense]MCH5136121.1 MATE family efflux transporter [Clostridiaceae bacterium UIB06]